MGWLERDRPKVITHSYNIILLGVGLVGIDMLAWTIHHDIQYERHGVIRTMDESALMSS